MPQTAAAYAVVGWMVVEACATIFPLLRLPDWTPTLVLVFVLLGFPVALVLSWTLALRIQREGELFTPAADGGPALSRAAPPGPAAALPAVPGAGSATPAGMTLDALPAGAPGLGAGEAARSLVVLPFDSLGPRADTEHFADGLTDDLITELSRISGLRVVSRTSAMLLKGTAKELGTIGRELGVRYVLEGTVRRAEGRLRVSAQLVDAETDSHLWAQRFDSDLADVFAIEDEITHRVSEALRVVLTSDGPPRQARVPPRDIRAYEHYLRGRQFFYQGRRKSLGYARDLFARAVEIDPGYALAYAGIADANALLRMYYPAGEADMAEAERASARALELAPELAEAHAARGAVLFLESRVEEAEREFRTALRLDPALFEAGYMFGRMCFQLGRFADAALLFERAHAAREDHQAAFFAAQSYEALGDVDRARASYDRALECVSRHMELNPDDARAATMRAVSLMRLSRREEGLRWAERALDIDPDDAGVRYNVACLFSLADERERALTCLEEAFRAGFGNPEWLAKDPDLGSLRDDPRFRALMERQDGARVKR